MFGNSCKRNGAYVLLVRSGNEPRTVEPERWKWISFVMKLWMIILILGGTIYVIDYFELRSTSHRYLANLRGIQEPIKMSDSFKGYLINTPGCRIPDMDPFDPSVMKYIETPSIKKCNKGISPLFQSNFTSIYMIPSALPQYGIENITELNCCYQQFIRRIPKGDSHDNQFIYDEKCTIIEGQVAHIDSEFIKIVCYNLSRQKIYEDYFPFVPARKNKKNGDIKMRPNVLVMGLDAVSRLNLHRQLPATHKFLTETIGAIELLGYNKVADNTFPNLIPVLTGMFETELQKACWPNSKARFDSCPFVWKNFSNNGYTTAIGEDCSSIGLFNYEKRGFREQPANYYITGFQWEMESKIGSDHDFNCKQCVGGRKSYTVQLDYIKKFVRRMQLQSTPYFGFFWGNSLSHDYLNRPASGDKTYLELFEYLKNNGHLSDTVLIFMSDHGIRWGDIRKTHQGQMEERLPFLLIALPEWFKSEYSIAVANIQRNVRRLTTPFDLHETLKDLTNVSKLSVRDNTLSNRTEVRGYSLFSQIPKSRTCRDAQIVSHWCTCQQSIEMKTNDSEVESAAEFAVYHMNTLLEGYAECATLVLDDIIGARLLSYDKKHMDGKHSVKDYTVTLKTAPGDGVFEVTVRIKDGGMPASSADKVWAELLFLPTTCVILVTHKGNVFVIAAILLERNLQNVANYLILSLAVADLLVACLVMPLGAVQEVSQEWSLGPELCDMWTSSDVLCCTASILHLVAIALDRYWAVTNVEYIHHRTSKRIGMMIFIIWTVSFLVCIAPLLGWKDPQWNDRIRNKQCLISQDLYYQIFATASSFYLPLLVILILYWRIFQTARKRIRRRRMMDTTQQTEKNPAATGIAGGLAAASGTGGIAAAVVTVIGRPLPTISEATTTTAFTNVSSNNSSPEKTSFANGLEADLPTTTGDSGTTYQPQYHPVKRKTRDGVDSKRERKAAKTLAIITGAFVLCWLPFFIMAVIMPINAQLFEKYMMSIFLWLGYFNSTLNPIIYTIFSPEFRHAFKKILCGRNYARRNRHFGVRGLA